MLERSEPVFFSDPSRRVPGFFGAWDKHHNHFRSLFQVTSFLFASSFLTCDREVQERRLNEREKRPSPSPFAFYICLSQRKTWDRPGQALPMQPNHRAPRRTNWNLGSRRGQAREARARKQPVLAKREREIWDRVRTPEKTVSDPSVRAPLIN
eukprot:jgi/Mesvir1/14364/Mv25163-RA.1